MRFRQYLKLRLVCARRLLGRSDATKASPPASEQLAATARSLRIAPVPRGRGGGGGERSRRAAPSRNNASARLAR
eukprot:177425-Pleurochrysis_carterae.AAC.3